MIRTLLLLALLVPRLALAVCTAGDNYSATVCADSPVGYWKLQETSGTTANDSSGNAKNGTYNSSWSLNQTGPFAGAVAAVATAGDTAETMTVTDQAIHDFGTGDFTAEIWAKSGTSGGANFGVMSKLNYSSPGWSIEGDPNNNSNWNIRYNGSQTCTTGGSTDGFVTNVWNRLSFTRSGTTLTKYRNATTITPCTVSNVNVDSSNGVQINSPFGGTYTLSVAHAAIYGTALSAARQQAHYNCGATGIDCAGGGPVRKRLFQSSWEPKQPAIAQLLARGVPPFTVDEPYFIAERLNAHVALVAGPYEAATQ